MVDNFVVFGISHSEDDMHEIDNWSGIKVHSLATTR